MRQNSTAFHDKTLDKLGKQGNYFNLIKPIYEKLTTGILLSGETLKAFPLGIRRGWPFTATSVQRNTGSSWHSHQSGPQVAAGSVIFRTFISLPWVWTFDWGQGEGRERESQTYMGVFVGCTWSGIDYFCSHSICQSSVTRSRLTAGGAGKQLCAQEEGEMDSWVAIKSNSFPSALFQLRERGLREVLGHRE